MKVLVAVLLLAFTAPAFTYQPAIRLQAATDPTPLTAGCSGPSVDTLHTADYPQAGEGKHWATFNYNGLGRACLHAGLDVACRGLDEPDWAPPYDECPGSPCTIWLPAYAGHSDHVWLTVEADTVCHGVFTASVWAWVLFIGP